MTVSQAECLDHSRYSVNAKGIKWNQFNSWILSISKSMQVCSVNCFW